MRSDELGRYAVPHLATGDRYSSRVDPGDGSADPGWKHQFPYIQTLRPGTAGFVRLPDLNLIDQEQGLSGVVVDPSGRPVPGVTVSAKLADSYAHLSRTWKETDSAGRFALDRLPNLPIELMVRRRNPRGGRILLPATARPSRDQKDIRICFDPGLTIPPEDLDVSAPTPGGRR